MQLKYTRQTLNRIAAWGTVVSITTAAAVYFFQEPWLYYPDGTEFVPSTNVVAAGTSMSLSVPRCNTSYDKKSYNIARTLVRLDKTQPAHSVDGGGDVTIDAREHGKHAFCDVLYKEYRIPDDLPAGIYVVSGDAIIKGFFGRVFIIHFTSRPFTVT